jgi:hypothetical protein
MYRLSAKLAPNWSVPWYNRGLLAKLDRRWAHSLMHNTRATELNPDDPAAWWNLGIAATALAEWDFARRAWRHHGVELPVCEGRPDMDLGPVPIRISPKANAEVVWCRRLDPARALILSVPLPESDRAFHDIVLHDGEPKGSRILSGRALSVFNELQLLEASAFQTYVLEIVAPSRADVAALEAAAAESSLSADDWSALEILCIACSEGTPHEHVDPPESNWKPERRIGLAAPTRDVVSALAHDWANASPGRQVRNIECVFARDAATGADSDN